MKRRLALLNVKYLKYFSCFGVGKRPEEGNARKWYKLVEQQRKAARQKTQEHKQKMLRCIETA